MKISRIQPITRCNVTAQYIHSTTPAIYVPHHQISGHYPGALTVLAFQLNVITWLKASQHCWCDSWTTFRSEKKRQMSASRLIWHHWVSFRPQWVGWICSTAVANSPNVRKPYQLRSWWYSSFIFKQANSTVYVVWHECRDKSDFSRAERTSWEIFPGSACVSQKNVLSRQECRKR